MLTNQDSFFKAVQGLYGYRVYTWRNDPINHADLKRVKVCWPNGISEELAVHYEDEGLDFTARLYVTVYHHGHPIVLPIEEIAKHIIALIF